jgi:hypothetical protein
MIADRAKQIKTKAVVNESPTEKLIRELREENERLALLLKQGGGAPAEVTSGDDDNDSEELKAQLEENERQMNEMKESWEKKLKEAQDALRERDNEEEQKKLERQSHPHLYNLNVDPQLTGMIVHTLKPGDQQSAWKRHTHSRLCSLTSKILDLLTVFQLGCFECDIVLCLNRNS